MLVAFCCVKHSIPVLYLDMEEPNYRQQRNALLLCFFGAATEMTIFSLISSSLQRVGVDIMRTTMSDSCSSIIVFLQLHCNCIAVVDSRSGFL